MDEDVLAQFISITSADSARAQQYLTITDGNLEQAIQLFFESDGVDLGGAVGGGSTSNPSQVPREVVNLDSDEENDEPLGSTGASAIGQRRNGPSVEDDEAMARRMQEEMYGVAGGADAAGGPVDFAQTRAPVARTAETLLGPGADWRDDPGEMNAAIFEQLQSRHRRPVGRPGIFNQRPPPGSIWEDTSSSDPETRRQNLSRATAGASDASSKTSMLAEMYRPPFEIMSKITSWDEIRDEGREQEKWILVNVQDPNIFDCQVLNRDIWKNPQIQDTVREHFLFKQFNKDDPEAANYVRFYFQAYESQDAYPHIAIVDPRTGEQVKVWSGIPSPKPMDFLMQLHEFLDRYSLKANTRNPVATRKAEKRKQMDVDKMTEEEMLEMAMQNSLEARPGPRETDPDTLTRNTPTANSSAPGTNGLSTPQPGVSIARHERTPEPELPPVIPSPFAQISATNTHTEPPADPLTTTRIQFRHPGGRVVRRFAVSDPVRRIYEWLKSEPLEGKEGQAFELVFMGKNLMDNIDDTITGAGLKNGSVMVEFVDT